MSGPARRRGPRRGAALRIALRDLGGGFRGFRVMLACLALGVAAIAGIGSLTGAVRDGLARDARVLLGGDLDIRLTQMPAGPAELNWFRAHAESVSAMARMRAMAARADGRAGGGGRARALIELKAVDGAYPLYGEVATDPPGPLAAKLARGADGTWGAVAEAALLARLGLEPGDKMRIGLAVVTVRATLLSEPDKATGAFKLGPTVMIGEAALPATGLVQPGSLIRYHYRLRYAPGTDGAAVEAALDRAFPVEPWRVRNAEEATPRIERHINRAALFFTLVGLTALLVGGIGVAGAVTAHLDGKRETIATLKCLGATGRFVFAVYAVEVGIMAALGIVIGLMIGAALPLAIIPSLAPYLPVVPGFSLQPAALAAAAAYGAAVAALFTLWPLARAREVPAAALFRGLVAEVPFRPRAATVAALIAAALVIVALAVMTAYRPRFALWFIAGAAIAFAVFQLAGIAVRRLARATMGRLAARRRSWPRLQLALANIARPGAPAQSIVLALGIGLTVFVALAEIEGNFHNEIAARMPQVAPAYFFVDIQPGQVDAFESTVKSVPGAGRIERMPSLRGRIAALNGTPIESIDVRPGARWAVESDRGVTYAGAMPEGTDIVAGRWWPSDYSGPPLLSIDARIAEGLGARVGDTVTLNILGREITARIANTRRIDWARLGLNYTLVLAPGALEGAPQTYIATVQATAAAEEPLARAVIDRFGNVTAIRVREALEAVTEALTRIGTAARATAGLALVAGVLVLGGAIAAGRRERTRDAVILKITGTRRRDLLVAYLAEYGITGAAAGLFAAALGTGAAYFVLTRLMDLDWVFLPGPALATLVIGALAVIGFGFLGTWRALARKPAEVLREGAP